MLAYVNFNTFNAPFTIQKSCIIIIKSFNRVVLLDLLKKMFYNIENAFKATFSKFSFTPYFLEVIMSNNTLSPIGNKSKIIKLMFFDYFPIKDVRVGHIIDPLSNTPFDSDSGLKNYLLIFVLDGKGTLSIDNRIISFKANDTLFIKRDTTYSISITSNSSEFISLSFAAEYIANMLIEYSVFSGVYPIDSAAAFQQFLQIAEMEQSKSSGFMVAENIHSVIIRMASHYLRTSETLSRIIKTEIDSHVYNKFSIKDITDTLHISKSTLMRTFKKAYGVTPHEYLIDKRMEIAKSLLTTTKLAIKSIAYMLCFSDERYFSYAFTQKTGVSPNEYRNTFNGQN